MNKRRLLAVGVLLSGLCFTAAWAADDEQGAGADQAQAQEQAAEPAVGAGGGAEAGQVSQAKIDYEKKREEMRKRRDEALKTRAQNAK